MATKKGAIVSTRRSNRPAFSARKPKSEYVEFHLEFGGHHNLEELLNEVNYEYFDGKIQAFIGWGRQLGERHVPRPRRSIRLGWLLIPYGIIYVHRILNDPRVPREVIKWVIFHEMLHIKHHTHLHPRRLRIEEETFAYYDRVLEWRRENEQMLLCS